MTLSWWDVVDREQLFWYDNDENLIKVKLSKKCKFVKAMILDMRYAFASLCLLSFLTEKLINLRAYKEGKWRKNY